MLVNEFWKIPFLRLIIPFITGIVIANYFDFSISYSLLIALFFIAFAIVYRPFLNHQPSYHQRWIFGAILTLALFFSGCYLTRKSMQYESKIIESELITGIVNEPPKINPQSVKVIIKTNQYQANKIWYKATEKILINLEIDSLATHLKYGDLIIIKGNLKDITNAGNPSEFDYRKYLARKHIHFKSYQNSNEWALIGNNSGNPLSAAAYKIREKMLNTYLDAGIKGEEFGLLAALTLGSMDYLSDEIIQAYSDSGAMHVLSVSGLHVGIIFIVLNQLLFFLRKKRYLLILQAILIISAIWFYAVLTGLSPAVNRSAVMISFVIIGRVSNKKPSIYNTVLASAFILLFIDPLTLFDVGFQLSYMAVLSIIFFHQRIYLLYETKSTIIDKIWSLTSVSIAAQIGTSILSIYYFHQFPVYALITNLIVVPLSFVVMLMAITLLATSFFLALAKIVGSILSATIFALNYSVKFVEHLPLATIEPISLNSFESILLHIAIVLILIFIVTKSKRMVPLILALFILAFGFRDFRLIKLNRTKTFTVFNLSKKSAFSLINDGNLHLYTDSSMYSNTKSIRYLTSNIMADNYVSTINLNKLEISRSIKENSKGNGILKYLICMDSIRVVYLTGDFSNYKSNNKLKVNYVVLSKNASMDIEPIQSIFDFQMLIADSSVPKWKLEILKRDCQQLEIPFYNVSESGAFICQIEK